MSSLPALIRRVADDYGLHDPRAIAERVAETTPDELLDAYYTTALIVAVRVTLDRQRNDAIGRVITTTAPSAKLAQRRDWWSDFLATRIHVPAGWKTIGDCTALDLRHAEVERRAAAAKTVQRADFYSLLRGQLAAHGVDTVGQLPADALRHAHRAAA